MKTMSEPRLSRIYGFSRLCNTRYNPINPKIGGIVIQTKEFDFKHRSTNMPLKFLPLAAAFLFLSCTEVKFENPDDPDSPTYRGNASLSSDGSSSAPSSSSSSVVQNSSSENALSSSSSSVASSSSSAVSSSSSSSVPSNSSSSSVSITSNCSLNGRTVKIGVQTWMAENLNCDVSGSRCYNDDPANCTKYGRLYDWETAKRVCPSGWHLPSDDEWTVLTNFVGSSAGKKLKATNGWNSAGNGTDNYGFAALPSGYGYSGGVFNDVGYGGVWWSATENYANYAYSRDMYYNNGGVNRSDDYKLNLFSVRCLQD